MTEAMPGAGPGSPPGAQRRARVLDLYNQGTMQSADDHYHAALVMLYGEDVAHYEHARTFARRATVLGSRRSWSIIAAAWDRSLIQRGKPQRADGEAQRRNRKRRPLARHGLYDRVAE